MNEIVNNLLLAADKFMHEMHLRQQGFTYSALWTIYKKPKKEYKSLKKKEIHYIYKNEIDKVCFQHDMPY